MSVFERVHRQACECIRRGDYVMTLHAEEEMSADRLTVFDVENAILTGRVAQRQKDSDTGEWKYLFRGKSLTGSAITAVVKLSRKGSLVIITVYGAKLTNGKQR